MRVLRKLWTIVQWVAAAIALVSGLVSAHLFIVAGAGETERGHLQTSDPIRAPLSGADVCGYHLCVEHPRGSTCTGSTKADELTIETDTYSGPIHTRWFEQFRWDASRSVTKQSAPGELLAPVESERITNRCRDAVCAWTEHVIRCGEPHDVRIEHGWFQTYVRGQEESKLSLMALTWILGLAFIVGLIVGKTPLEKIIGRISRLVRR